VRNFISRLNCIELRIHRDLADNIEGKVGEIRGSVQFGADRELTPHINQYLSMFNDCSMQAAQVFERESLI
jgi:hypothetical protein